MQGPLRTAGFGYIWILSATWFTLTSPVCAQTYLFGRGDFTVGNGPTAVISADLNGDGKPDLIATNLIDNTVSVLIGTADGGFASKVDYATGYHPSAIAVADVNGDGKADILVVNQNCTFFPNSCVPNGPGSVSVLLGNGDGTLQPRTDYTVGNTPIAVAVADFNQDNIFDLAICESAVSGAAPEVAILLGKGDGTFQSPVDYPSGALSALVAADLNGDSKLDLVTGGSVLLGNGDGTFQPFSALPGNGLFAGLVVAAGDLNGDGVPDIVTAPSDSLLVIFKGVGDGTFITAGTIQVKAAATAVTLTDLYGKDSLDIVANLSFPGDNVAVLLGNGDLTFGQENDYAIGSSAGLAIADFNGDGRNDVAVAVPSSPGTVAVLLGLPHGAFAAKVNYAAVDNPDSVITGDFNHDNHLDVATSSNSSTVDVFLGNGDGTLQTPQSFPAPGSNSSSGLTAADFNRDGLLDLATIGFDCISGPGCDTTYLGTLFGNGDGTFQPYTQYAVFDPVAVVAGDLNRDGFPDVVVSNISGNSVSVFLNKKDGTLQSPILYQIPGGAGSIALSDLNLDGNPDLVVGTSPSAISVLLGNGDATFQKYVNYPLPSDPGGIVVGDFNGDGKPDVAASTYDPTSHSSSVSILLGNGDGTLQPYVACSVPGSYTGLLSLGDVNGDGKLDVIVGGQSLGTGVSVLLGNGDGTFQSARNFQLGDITLTGLASGDLNGDGVSELIGTDNDSVTVSVLPSIPFKALYPRAKIVFPSQGVGTTSGPQSLTLANPGAVSFAVTSIVTSGDFSTTNDCPAMLSPAATCTISVTFSPTQTGSESGSITLTDGTRSSPQTIVLSGTGVNGPFLVQSTSSLSFGTISVGSSSGPSVVTISNTGNAALQFTSIAITGANTSDFTQANTCGSSLAAGGICTISVTFSPTDTGFRTASVTIKDNAPGSPHSISLSGTGTAPKASLSVSSLTFASQIVNTTSTAQTVTLTNTGNVDLTISSISASGDFAQTNTCGTSVSAGSSCPISTTFTPTGAGTRSEMLTITDNAAGSPQTVSLSGTGTAAGLGLTVPSGSSDSQTVNAGAPANYTLSIGGQGMSGTATLSCTGAPMGATCSLIPTSVSVSATHSSTFTVTVGTTARSAARLDHGSGRSSTSWMWAFGIFWLMLLPSTSRRKRILTHGAGVIVVAVLFILLSGCGGSSSSPATQTGTPAGTYTLTVTATSGATTQSLPLTLIVN
jgi:hypothetical protein